MFVAIPAAALAVLAWVYLLAGRGGYWRTDQRLPSADPGWPESEGGSTPWPAVVAVVPARDEAEVLPDTLPTLLSQEYGGEFAVVLVDDQSTDGTAEVATGVSEEAHRAHQKHQEHPGAEDRLKIISGTAPPPGWAGKVWAMEQGLRASGQAEYVLFTDADIAYAPGTLAALVRAAESSGRAMVSQMALLRSDTFAERLLIPAFIYFFAQLYPFRWVNRRTSRTAAAAGGCMLVRRRVLADAGGLERISGARIDDVALGGLLKRPPASGDCWLGFTTDVLSRRSYARFSEVWDMVARSAYTQLRYSPIALAGTVVGLAFLYLLPVAAGTAGLVLLIGGRSSSGVSVGQASSLAVLGFAAWALMSVTYLPVLKLSGLSPVRAPGLPVIAAVYAAMTVSSAKRHQAGRGGEWKGRTIPAAGPERTVGPV